MENVILESFKVFGPVIGMLVMLTFFAFFLVRWLLKTSHEREIRLSNIIEASTKDHLEVSKTLTALRERIKTSIQTSERAHSYQKTEHDKLMEQHSQILQGLIKLNGKVGS